MAPETEIPATDADTTAADASVRPAEAVAEAARPEAPTADAGPQDAPPPPSADAGRPDTAAGPDPFAVLAAIGSAPAAFPDAAADVARAGREIFARQATSKGLGAGGLRRLHGALGDGVLRAMLLGLRPGDVSKLLAGVDPHKPGLSSLSPAEAASRVAEIAAGAPPVAAADAASLDLAGLRDAAASLGPDFAGWLAALKGGEARKAAARLDPHLPGVGAMDADAARAHLAALAEGREPTSDIDLETMDLDGLRTARDYLGDGFAPWLSALKAGDAKRALARVDGHRPGLSGLDAAGVRGRLADLAAGGEPFPAIPLDDLDLGGLGAAREEVGPDAFEAWLDDLKPGDVKRTVVRLDPERPGVRKLRPEEYRDALSSLAERMAPHAGGRRLPCVGDITFGRARHDEERHPASGVTGE